ncbi:MAG: ATP-dependent metallopeptidase FtsH/Yme1/Tma family protein, partial [Candidatus Dormibacteria bacterium]
MPRNSPTPTSGNSAGGPGSPAGGSGAPPRKPSPWRSTQFLLPLGIFLALNLLVANVLFPPSSPKTISLPYNVFIANLKAGDVTSITSTGNAIQGTFRHPTAASAKSSNKALHFTTQMPTFAGGQLETLLEQHNVTINAQVQSTPALLELLYSFGPTLLFLLIFIWFIRRTASSANGGLF